MAARSTQKSAPSAPAVDPASLALFQQFQAFMALSQQTEAAPAPAQKAPATRKPAAKAPVAPRRVKTENLDNPASQRQIMGAFFEAFQVIYGEKLTGWPTRGAVEAIRDDLQTRISKRSK